MEQKISKQRWKKFLEAYYSTRNCRQAAETYHIDLDDLYDAKYLDDIEKVSKKINSDLLAKAYNLAIDGLNESVYYKNEQIGVKIIHFPTLIQFMIKRNDDIKEIPTPQYNVEEIIQANEDIGSLNE